DGHQHETNCAISSCKCAESFREAFFDEAGIDRVENDDGAIGHAQGGGGVDPVAAPAGLAQRLVDGFGVVAALTTDENVAGGKIAKIGGVEEFRAGAALGRSSAACVGRGEKHRFDAGEVVFRTHPFEQDAAYHPSPADESDAHSSSFL